jgi:hypothetical protein
MLPSLCLQFPGVPAQRLHSPSKTHLPAIPAAARRKYGSEAEAVAPSEREHEGRAAGGAMRQQAADREMNVWEGGGVCDACGCHMWCERRIRHRHALSRGFHRTVLRAMLLHPFIQECLRLAHVLEEPEALCAPPLIFDLPLRRV